MWPWLLTFDHQYLISSSRSLGGHLCPPPQVFFRYLRKNGMYGQPLAPANAGMEALCFKRSWFPRVQSDTLKILCPTTSPKAQVSSFTVINYKDKQQNLYILYQLIFNIFIRWLVIRDKWVNSIHRGRSWDAAEGPGKKNNRAFVYESRTYLCATYSKFLNQQTRVWFHVRLPSLSKQLVVISGTCDYSAFRMLWHMLCIYECTGLRCSVCGCRPAAESRGCGCAEFWVRAQGEAPAVMPGQWMGPGWRAQRGRGPEPPSLWSDTLPSDRIWRTHTHSCNIIVMESY